MNRIVRDWMTPSPSSVSPDLPLDEVVDRMYQGSFRHVPVVEGGRVVGLISYTDLIRVGFGDDLPSNEGCARDVMVGPVATTTPQTPLAEAASLMLAEKYGCLPVVQGDQLVGILTDTDFVRGVAEGR
ncbi:MAG: acetoin utilization protein AcuB [Myxococcota bacterium]|jgi:acetoin utilization protein AcuB